jgi:hypothetical protein
MRIIIKSANKGWQGHYEMNIQLNNLSDYELLHAYNWISTSVMELTKHTDGNVITQQLSQMLDVIAMAIDAKD